jgi:AcrR family transcriptional regulator
VAEQVDVESAAAPRGRGRPRSAPRKNSALSTREEILAAAAQLFGSQGYTETTTRQIADAVGIKQASLYYHFPDKSQILRSLLKGTVAPSVQLARWLRGGDAGDLDPDIAETEFVETRESQVALRSHYRELSAAVLTRQGVDPAALAPADLELVFGLVEGIIGQRQWGDDGTRAAYADAVVRGCLRLVHVPEPDIAPAVAAGTALAERFRAEGGEG